VLHVDNIPDGLYERLHDRATVEGRSLAEEVIALLERELGEPRPSIRELLDSIERRRERYPLPAGAPDVVELLREDRAR
jgi:plasmid stability protein